MTHELMKMTVLEHNKTAHKFGKPQILTDLLHSNLSSTTGVSPFLNLHYFLVVQSIPRSRKIKLFTPKTVLSHIENIY